MDTSSQRDPPDTTTGVLEDELIPLDDGKPFDVVEVDVELELDVAPEVGEEDVPPLPAEAEAPGMVAALTALNTPTPATAASAAPTVMRLSIRIAESRALTLPSRWSVQFMSTSLATSAEPYLGSR